MDNSHNLTQIYINNVCIFYKMISRFDYWKKSYIDQNW